MDILEGLNPPQQEAVQAVEGPLLVLAGPGSGKTRVIAHRVAYLIKVVGIRPYHILAVTFTNKAAGEMRQRLEGLLGKAVEGLTLGTFHAFGARLLRQEGVRVGLDSQFVIYDDEDHLSLIKRCLEELGIDPRRFPPKAVQSAIESAKSRLLSPSALKEQIANYFDEVVHRAYERYQARLSQNQALDFDDLLMKPVFLFREHPDALDKYQSRYLHILIDEFQDTNLAQYELAKQLAGKYRNICVVGDPDQSIYSWRYADLRNILSFERDFPQARVVYLEQNYRSTQTILQVASQIIALNKQRKPKRLWTENEPGPPLSIVEVHNEEEEAQFVVGEVERLQAQGMPLRECAVMYRTNAQSRALEEACLRFGLPYKLVGAVRFYQRREVKDVLAYLRLLHNPRDNISLGRIINIPLRGIGPRTLAELTRWADGLGLSAYEALGRLKDGDSPFPSRPRGALLGFLELMEELRPKSQELKLVELLDLVLERTGYQAYLQGEADGEERWENILELRNVAQQYQEKGLEGFLEGVSLVSDVDNLDEKKEGITLITLHQAKGLEFDTVFIVGMEEGVLPHYRSLADSNQMEEERRLCYVGVTRAKKRLYLLRAFRRTLGGMSAPNPPSRFLEDIPRELVARLSPGEDPAPHFAPLRIGDQVRHTLFGEGTVVSTTSLRQDQEVTVVFRDAGIKRLLLSLAPLEVIK